jgi:CheY-like chemotaxis protein
VDGTVARAVHRPAPMHQRPAVLVIADDHPVRSGFCDVLEAAGLDALDAHDGPEAFDVLYKRRDVAAIVLDLGMRFSEPKQIRMQLFRSQRLRGLPLIVLAACEHDAFGLAADLVLTRPIDLDAALRSIVDVLRPVVEPQHASP